MLRINNGLAKRHFDQHDCRNSLGELPFQDAVTTPRSMSTATIFTLKTEIVRIDFHTVNPRFRILLNITACDPAISTGSHFRPQPPIPLC